jgi:L-alanine-DL-glutamate epimerase-like enolase superfamily enzyme
VAVIQLKLGVGTPDDDVDHVATALNSMTEWQTLLADANGGWGVEQACNIISLFDDKRVIWEEPCATYEDIAEVAARTGRPVMADQCVGHLPVAMKAISEGIVSSICTKPPLLGGLTIGRHVMDACVSSGMQMRIDGPFCGDIASAANLHLAVCAPPELLIAGCDLREPLAINSDLQGVA